MYARARRLGLVTPMPLNAKLDHFLTLRGKTVHNVKMCSTHFLRYPMVECTRGRAYLHGPSALRQHTPCQQKRRFIIVYATTLQGAVMLMLKFIVHAVEVDSLHQKVAKQRSPGVTCFHRFISPQETFSCFVLLTPSSYKVA